MTLETVLWFSGQAAAALLGFWGGLRISSCRDRAWKTAAVVATVLMLGWPLARLVPAHLIRWFGAKPVAFLEVTGIIIPAAVLFSISIRHIRTAGQRRAIILLVIACGLYFVRNGSWMIRPAIPDLGPTRVAGRVCLQSTGYTCVAASMVTMLKVYGIDSTETEMAHLSHTEVDFGTTDSRAVVGLRTKLSGMPIEVCYEAMDYERLKAVPKPCMVPVTWGYFVSHMVPVLSMTDGGVKVGDPSTGGALMPREKFVKVWHKRGIFLRDLRK